MSPRPPLARETNYGTACMHIHCTPCRLKREAEARAQADAMIAEREARASAAADSDDDGIFLSTSKLKALVSFPSAFFGVALYLGTFSEQP